MTYQITNSNQYRRVCNTKKKEFYIYRETGELYKTVQQHAQKEKSQAMALTNPN
jgi:hypothetical protein